MIGPEEPLKVADMHFEIKESADAAVVLFVWDKNTLSPALVDEMKRRLGRAMHHIIHEYPSVSWQAFKVDAKAKTTF